MERRKNKRINVSLPIECQVQLLDSLASWSSPGVLKNLSVGGVYFVCETLPFIRQGDIGEFIFRFVGDLYDENYIRAKGRVNRVEHHVSGFTDYGVAIEFLLSPSGALMDLI